MIKFLALPIIALFTTIHPAISALNHSQSPNIIKSMSKNNKNKVAFFGDNVWGEGALKLSCLRYWKIKPFHNDMFLAVDPIKCDKAAAEIEFAKREYPGILHLARTLKYTKMANEKPIEFTVIYQKLKRKCTDKTAIRAANTARYWGTNEVGSTSRTRKAVIPGFSKISPGQYGLILEACEEDSWLDEKLILVQDSFEDALDSFGLPVNETPIMCDASKANRLKKSIGEQYVNGVKKQLREHSDTLEYLEIIEASSHENPKDIGLPYEKIYSARERLKNRIKACKNALIVSRKHASDNQEARQTKERLQRQYAAEEERLQRQYAAEEQRRINFQNAIDSVNLD